MKELQEALRATGFMVWVGILGFLAFKLILIAVRVVDFVGEVKDFRGGKQRIAELEAELAVARVGGAYRQAGQSESVGEKP